MLKTRPGARRGSTSERYPQARLESSKVTASPSLPYVDFERVGPRVGERFPDVRLPDQHGQEIDLHAARRGRRALVVVYRSASW